MNGEDLVMITSIWEVGVATLNANQFLWERNIYKKEFIFST